MSPPLCVADPVPVEDPLLAGFSPLEDWLLASAASAEGACFSCSAASSTASAWSGSWAGSPSGSEGLSSVSCAEESSEESEPESDSTASGSPMMASSAPTSTVSSSSALISRRVPATGDGISVSTLSVEISRRGSST